MRGFNVRRLARLMAAMGIMTLACDLRGEAVSLQIREIFLEESEGNARTMLGQFVDPNGSRLVTIQPFDLSREGIPKGWVLRIVEPSTKQVVASRTVEPPPSSECTFYGTPFYDPRLEIVQGNSGKQLLFHVCRTTQVMSADDLSTREVVRRIQGRVSPRGKWAIAIDKLDKGNLAGTLMNLQEGRETCRFNVKIPDGMDAELGEVFWAHDDSIFGILIQHGTRPKGKGLYTHGVQLQVHKRASCDTLSKHLFPAQIGLGPDPSSRFAGSEWQWLVSGPAIKTKKGSPLTVWDWRTGRKVVDLRYKDGTANVLDVSPEGRYVVVAKGDEHSKRSVRDFVIWDLQTQRVVYESPKYSPGLKRSEYEKVVVGKDGTPARIRTVLPYNMASFSTDGKRLLHISGYGIAVYEITRGR